MDNPTDKKQTTDNQEPNKDKDVEANKNIAAYSYVWILFLVPLFGRRDSKFAQFHAKQGGVMFLFETLAWLLIPLPFIGFILFLAIFLVAVMGVIKALNGEWWEIPYVYNWSKKIKI